MTTGQKIYECRKRLGMTQEELADKLGVTRQAVSKWEQDTAFPETDKVLELCKLFSVSADELLFGRESVCKVQPPKEMSIEEAINTQTSVNIDQSDNINNNAKSAQVKTIEQKYNLFSVFGFCAEIIASVLMLQIIGTLLIALVSDGYDAGKLSIFPLLVFMIVGLILAIIGLGTGKRFGKKGRGLAVSAIWIFVCLFIIIAVFMILVGVFAGGLFLLIFLPALLG